MPRFANNFGSAALIDGVPYVRKGKVKQLPDSSPDSDDILYVEQYTYGVPDDNGKTVYTPAQRVITLFPTNNGYGPGIPAAWPEELDEFDEIIVPTPWFTAPSAGVIRLFTLLGQSGASARVYINGAQVLYQPGTFVFTEGDAKPFLLSSGDTVASYHTPTMFYRFLPDSY